MLLLSTVSNICWPNFSIPPKTYSSMFTIFGYKHGHYISLVNCLLPDQSIHSYRLAFASYKGCFVYKELHQKMFPPLRQNHLPNTKFYQPGQTYAQAVNGNNQQSNTAIPLQHNTWPTNNLSDIAELLKTCNGTDGHNVKPSNHDCNQNI